MDRSETNFIFNHHTQKKDIRANKQLGMGKGTLNMVTTRQCLNALYYASAA